MSYQYQKHSKIINSSSIFQGRLSSLRINLINLKSKINDLKGLFIFHINLTNKRIKYFFSNYFFIKQNRISKLIYIIDRILMETNTISWMANTINFNMTFFNTQFIKNCYVLCFIWYSYSSCCLVSYY